MRIPPLYNDPRWQCLFAGAVIGGCVSWLIFLFMFGTIQEEQTRLIEKQRKTITDLKESLSIWQEDYKELNKKNEEVLTVQDIEVEIIHSKKYHIEDSQSIFEAEEEVKKDVSSLLAKDLFTIYKNRELIKKIIENKTVILHNRRYNLTIKEMYFYTKVTLVLELKLANE